MEKQDIVRVVRVMEYVGPRDWVEKTLSLNAVPPNGEKSFGKGTIKSAMLGSFAEILERATGSDD